MHISNKKKLAARATELGKSASPEVLPDLRDLYTSPVEKDYVKRSVVAAGKQIRTAVEIAERSVVHGCKRCGVESHGERLASENIGYRYDERFRILDGYAIHPDFYLPERDVYIGLLKKLEALK